MGFLRDRDTDILIAGESTEPGERAIEHAAIGKASNDDAESAMYTSCGQPVAVALECAGRVERSTVLVQIRQSAKHNCRPFGIPVEGVVRAAQHSLDAANQF